MALVKQLLNILKSVHMWRKNKPSHPLHQYSDGRSSWQNPVHH